MRKAESQDRRRNATKRAGTFVYQAIVDTPKGSRNKYKIDKESGRFKLAGVLTAGAVFPYDFGYLPETLGEDGDALDVLILMDEPAFVGCQIEIRVIGGIEAEQTEDGKTVRNDRLIAVAVESHSFKRVRDLAEINRRLLDEIEHFFVSYNQIKGKVFEPARRSGRARAKALIAEGMRSYQRQQGMKSGD